MLGTEALPDVETLRPICRKHRVRRLALFGSGVRGQLRPESDVDLLVEYEAGFTPTYFQLVDLGDDLSPLFGDRFVDLIRPNALHPLIRDEVLSSARAIYEG